jgi:hypothetical protein
VVYPLHRAPPGEVPPVGSRRAAAVPPVRTGVRRRRRARATKPLARCGPKGARSRAHLCGCTSCSWGRCKPGVPRGAAPWLVLGGRPAASVEGGGVRGYAQHHMCFAAACLHLAKLEGKLGSSRRRAGSPRTCVMRGVMRACVVVRACVFVCAQRVGECLRITTFTPRCML